MIFEKTACPQSLAGSEEVTLSRLTEYGACSYVLTYKGKHVVWSIRRASLEALSRQPAFH